MCLIQDAFLISSQNYDSELAFLFMTEIIFFHRNKPLKKAAHDYFFCELLLTKPGLICVIIYLDGGIKCLMMF